VPGRPDDHRETGEDWSGDDEAGDDEEVDTTKFEAELKASLQAIGALDGGRVDQLAAGFEGATAMKTGEQIAVIMKNLEDEISAISAKHPNLTLHKMAGISWRHGRRTPAEVAGLMGELLNVGTALGCTTQSASST
jgi:hypothetical protein